jgi:hypothetical protein
MAVTLKRLIGEGGAGLDDSMGFSNLYDVLKALAQSQADLVTQFNQFRTDYNATIPVQPTTAAALTTAVTVE